MATVYEPVAGTLGCTALFSINIYDLHSEKIKRKLNKLIRLQKNERDLKSCTKNYIE